MRCIGVPEQARKRYPVNGLSAKSMGLMVKLSKMEGASQHYVPSAVSSNLTVDAAIAR